VYEITDNSQFAGTVSWSPEPAGGVFDEFTAYTATVALTAKQYFTFDGVAANFFDVSGAVSVTNAANSGIVTALFARTGGTPDKFGMRDITAAQIVSEMTIGWNLGNTFDATATGNNDPETAWINVRTTKAMIDKLADAGFDVFRIPITWDTGAGDYRRVGDGPEYTISNEFLTRIEEVVNWGLDNGMYVIINSHHDRWITLRDSTYDAESAKFAAMWKQIAERFKVYGDHLIFEDMNEPINTVGSEDWTGRPEYYNNVNRLNQLAVDTIRATGGNNVNRFIMLPSYAASSGATQMNAFVLPSDTSADKLIASVHAYTPYNFALNTSNAYNQWGSAGDKQELKNLFAEIDKAFISKGIPVVLGEFGAMNKNNEAVRAVWGKYFISGARQYGIPCVWWDNNAFTSGERFGLLNRGELSFPYPLLLKGLMSGLTYKVPMNLSIKPAYVAADKKWQIEVTLRNIDRTNIVYSGSVSLISPEGYTTVDSMDYDDLAFGDEAVMIFDINPQYTYTAAQEVIQFNYTAYDSVNNITYIGEDPAMVKFGLVTTAAYTPGPIAIDGDMGKDAWKNIGGIIDFGRGVIDGDGTPASTLDPDDLSAKGKIAWDEDYLYLAVIVKDDVHFQTKTNTNDIWQGDGIQISLGDIAGEREMGFALNSENGLVYRHCWTNSTGSGAGTGAIGEGDVKSAIIRNEENKSTKYELAIKWDYVGIDGHSITADDMYRLSICINDYDNATDRKFIEFGEGIAVGPKGSNMGYLILLPEVKLVHAVPSAAVLKKNGNTNDLTVTVTESYSDGSKAVLGETFTIANNSEGTFKVGDYKVFVNTKGNTQIREIYFVK
jgi:endoglucanase